MALCSMAKGIVGKVVAVVGCLAAAQLGAQFLWTLTWAGRPTDAETTRPMLGHAIRSAVRPPPSYSVILLGPNFVPSDASEFLLSVATALHGLGHEVRAFGSKDGHLRQDLLDLGIQAQVCHGLEKLLFERRKEMAQAEGSLQDAVTSECGIHRAQLWMLFTDTWAQAIANHRKGPNDGSLLWFFFPLDHCLSTQVGADVADHAFQKADHIIFLTAQERTRWQSASSSRFRVFRPFVDVDRLIKRHASQTHGTISNYRTSLQGSLPASGFIITLDAALYCDFFTKYPEVEIVLSQRFGSDWFLVMFAPCEAPLGSIRPNGRNLLVTYDKEVLYQHMLAAHLHVSLDSSGPLWSTMYASALGLPSLAMSFNVNIRTWTFYGRKLFGQDLQRVETVHGDLPIVNADGEAQDVRERCGQMYSMLSGLLLGKPLRMLRQVEPRNGFEAWGQLTQTFVPKTRGRAISILSALVNAPNFTRKSRTPLDQVLGLERLRAGYVGTSGVAIAGDVMLSVPVRALPNAAQKPVQLLMTEASSYNQVGNDGGTGARYYKL
eukprot:s31_g11.t1